MEEIIHFIHNTDDEPTMSYSCCEASESESGYIPPMTLRDEWDQLQPEKLAKGCFE